MSLNPELLRTSFAVVAERQPQLTLRFYEILFERYPELQGMFRRDRQAQADMLTQAIVAVMDHLEDANWLQSTLSGLGAKHVGYGVTPPMYDMVSECLRAAMAEAAGEVWNEEINQAWATALGAIRDLMLAGAEQAEQARATA